MTLYDRDATHPARAAAAEAIAGLEQGPPGRSQDPEGRGFLGVDVYEAANAAPRIAAGIFEGSRDTRWTADTRRDG